MNNQLTGARSKEQGAKGKNRAEMPIAHRARAFSLIELLVTIGIFAILMAILLPALQSIRQRQVELKCVVHMRNSSQANELYASSNRGFVPYAGSSQTIVNNPAREQIAVGGVYGLYLGHWADLMPDYWMGELWNESLACPDQPEYDPAAPDWPDASPSIDGFRRQPWYDLSAAFHLTPQSLARGSRLHNATAAAMPLSSVRYPSSKSLLYENLGFCIPKSSESLFWIDAGQTQRYATSVALVDGSVFRYARRNAFEPVFGVGLEYTMDGVLGRDIDHTLIGADAHHRFGQPDSWADTD